MSKELEQDMEKQQIFPAELSEQEAQTNLRKTIKDLISSLKYELEYAEEIQATLQGNRSNRNFLQEMDITDNLDYLIRDLNPEYAMQQGGFDTFSAELKKIQEYITAKNEEE